MTDRFHEDDLARLIREAADQVQPHPALDAIRARTVTPQKESAMSIARTWILGGLGGAVATAAVIGGVWFATTNDDDGSPDPAGSPTGTITGSQSPAPSESNTPSASGSSTPSTPTGAAVAVPAYYAGEAPGGLALYREFVYAPSTAKLLGAVRAAATADPKDRDYRTLWPADTKVTSAQVSDEPGDGLITIDLTGNLHDRPSGMTEREAGLAIEQLIYSAQGAVGMGRLPVQLLLDGKHTDTVLGVPTSEPLANAPVLQTLAHVNISTPAEGDVVTADKLTVTGVANSFEANVVIRLQRFEGTYIAFQEPVTAEGWQGDKLFPFQGSFDISKVTPGTYILSAMTDDPSGGAEGNGASSDDKVITIK
jgi:hypothetical protein